jgi:hypothetical protein
LINQAIQVTGKTSAQNMEIGREFPRRREPAPVNQDRRTAGKTINQKTMDAGIVMGHLRAPTVALTC